MPQRECKPRHTKGISNSAIQLYLWEGPELLEPAERSAVSDCQCWSISTLLPTGSYWKEKDFSETWARNTQVFLVVKTIVKWNYRIKNRQLKTGTCRDRAQIHPTADSTAGLYRYSSQKIPVALCRSLRDCRKGSGGVAAVADDDLTQAMRSLQLSDFFLPLVFFSFFSCGWIRAAALRKRTCFTQRV